jgi:hypothetical protein
MKRISMLLTLSLTVVVMQAMGQTSAVGQNVRTASNSIGAKSFSPSSLPGGAANPRCTLRTVRGDYAIGFSGNVLMPSVGPVATLGVISLDGTGGFTINDTASFAGALVDRVGAGTINVNQNCTGDATVTYTVGQPGRTATFNFVILDGGREIMLISTTEGSVVTGTAKAISPGAR